jgi:hypothetical protein
MSGTHSKSDLLTDSVGKAEPEQRAWNPEFAVKESTFVPSHLLDMRNASRLPRAGVFKRKSRSELIERLISENIRIFLFTVMKGLNLAFIELWCCFSS